ncbi:MAG: hypothetical protein ACREJC_01675 [Tepidisphaeraceae bacterium]
MTLLFEAYRPFLWPLPVWDIWYILLVPLCLGVSIVYKSIKCKSMSQVPRQALWITFLIVIGMIGAGAALAGIVRIVPWAAGP